MVCAIATLSVPAIAPAQSQPTAGDNTVVKFKTLPILTLSVTPNYASGYGAYKAQIGSTSSTGQTGSLAPGAIDFGSVYQGAVYLYKYAAYVKIRSNTNYALYAEGSADLTGYSGAAAGATLSLPQTLFWLRSTDGTIADTNSGYSPSTPFMATTQPGASYDTPTITYGAAYPAPIYTSNGNGDLYYDFQLHLPATAATGSYSVYVVYTAVPQ